ncbi:MAG TPA: MBL fold metallo-hydrolase [bacterium]|nr:MBL fold metallo-hydrolase [bacterium]HPN36251.1 MBL fold metallo-hydrolase [bacterium]
MAVHITIVVDNRAGPGLTAEHGLCFWIEVDGKRILFDTGQGRAFADNAQALGIDLRRTDALILSHGHYDHTGGIPWLLQAAPQAVVYAHPSILKERYSVRDGEAKPVSMPAQSRASLDNAGQQVVWVTESLTLFSRVELSGPIPRDTDFEDTGGPFYLDPQGEQPDQLEDDLALWIPTARGLVICLGCCHAGLVNTLHHIHRLSGQQPVHAVLGGLHLLQAGRERMARTVTALSSRTPDRLVPCHCTGVKAVEELHKAFPGRVSPGSAGLEMRFE